MSEFYTKVAGVTFEGRQRYIRHMQVGERLTLERDRYNSYDSNAIKVINASGEQIGFLSRDVAAQLAPKMDRGVFCYAVCSAITGDNPGDNLGVNIRVIEQEIKLNNIFSNVSVSKIETRIRIEAHTSGSGDVFSIAVYSYLNDSDDSIEIYDTLINKKSSITSFEVCLEGKFDYIIVNIEEHDKYRNYKFTITEDLLGGKYGIRFDEIADPYDRPSYAGGFAFYHPLFESSFVDYDSIEVNSVSHKIN